MKRLMKGAAIALCIVFLTGVISCKKESNNNGSGNATARNEINVKLNSNPWSGDVNSWAVSGGTRQINANGSDGSLMQIFMPVDTTGTFYAIDNLVTVSYNDGTVTYSNNVSGYVTITNNSDNHVEGSFEMKIASYFNQDTLDFTSGSFYYKGL